MAWEIFTKQVIRNAEPTVSITTMDSLAFGHCRGQCSAPSSQFAIAMNTTYANVNQGQPQLVTLLRLEEPESTSQELDMAWEIFTKQVIRNAEPTVSITTMGRLALNKAAAAILGKSAAELVLLLWDKEQRKVGIRVTTNKKDQRAYRISYGAKGNGGGFSSVTFLNYIHYDWSKTRSFPMDWNESEGTFVFSIPAEHLTGKPEAQQLQQLRLGSLRRSDRAKNTRKTREAISMTQ
jgi:hypothetical protein